MDAVADTEWGEVFEGIRSGSCHVAYWDGYTVERPGCHSFMRYALHRSTKRDGFLQLSVMEVRNGEIIPTSDTQHNTIKSLLAEVPNDAIVTVR